MLRMTCRITNRLSRLLPSPLLVAAALVAPGAALPAPSDPVVAEALFLYDALPPGGRDLNLSLEVAKADPDPVTGASSFSTSPRLQLALALGERVGLTADVGFASGGAKALAAPGASLKLLLREPGPARTGLAASLDLYGSSDALREFEAGLGLGAIRALGRVTVRAGASLASGVSTWSPHLHAGLSAALAFGGRWRALAEIVNETSAQETSFAAGPTVKVALSGASALAAGALFPLAGDAPTFTIQLTHSL
jgi:hypothetical protein